VIQRSRLRKGQRTHGVRREYISLLATAALPVSEPLRVVFGVHVTVSLLSTSQSRISCKVLTIRASKSTFFFSIAYGFSVAKSAVVAGDVMSAPK